MAQLVPMGRSQGAPRCQDHCLWKEGGLCDAKGWQAGVPLDSPRSPRKSEGATRGDLLEMPSMT